MQSRLCGHAPAFPTENIWWTAHSTAAVNKGQQHLRFLRDLRRNVVDAAAGLATPPCCHVSVFYKLLVHSKKKKNRREIASQQEDENCEGAFTYFTWCPQGSVSGLVTHTGTLHVNMQRKHWFPTW